MLIDEWVNDMHDGLIDDFGVLIGSFCVLVDVWAVLIHTFAVLMHKFGLLMDACALLATVLAGRSDEPIPVSVLHSQAEENARYVKTDRQTDRQTDIQTDKQRRTLDMYVKTER